MHIIFVIRVICWFVNIITAIHNLLEHALDIQISWVTLAYSLFHSHFHLIFILFCWHFLYSTNNSIVLAFSTDTYSPFICIISILCCSVNWVRDKQVRFIALKITLDVLSVKWLWNFYFDSSHLLFTFCAMSITIISKHRLSNWLCSCQEECQWI